MNISFFLPRRVVSLHQRRRVPFAEGDGKTAQAKPLRKQRDLGGFTRAVDPFHDNQSARTRDLARKKRTKFSMITRGPVALVDECVTARPDTPKTCPVTQRSISAATPSACWRRMSIQTAVQALACPRKWCVWVRTYSGKAGWVPQHGSGVPGAGAHGGGVSQAGRAGACAPWERRRCAMLRIALSFWRAPRKFWDARGGDFGAGRGPADSSGSAERAGRNPSSEY